MAIDPPVFVSGFKYACPIKYLLNCSGNGLPISNTLGFFLSMLITSAAMIAKKFFSFKFNRDTIGRKIMRGF